MQQNFCDLPVPSVNCELPQNGVTQAGHPSGNIFLVQENVCWFLISILKDRLQSSLKITMSLPHRTRLRPTRPVPGTRMRTVPRPLTLTGKLHVPLRTASSSACHWCGRDASGT